MRYRHSSVRGFSLIELLLSLAIAAMAIALVVSWLPKAANQSAQRALDTQALNRVNNLVSVIDAQFRPEPGTGLGGNFAGFSIATPSQLKAAFFTGSPMLIVGQLEENRNIHELKTVRIPGFEPVISQEYIVLGTKGLGKLITVTAATGDLVTFDCPLGIRSDGDMLIFKARGLSLAIEQGQLIRTVGGRKTPLGSAQGLSFKYVYANSSGKLTVSPNGMPNVTDAGRLVSFYPGAADVDKRAERTTAIPTASENVSRLMTCDEMGVITPDEARINVSILGLPDGATPDVMIYGPDRDVNNTRVPRTQTYTGVDAGEYRLEARDVTYQGRRYKSSVGGSPQRLWNTWGSINMAARYALTQGTLRIQPIGLPSGTARVTITGPNGYTNTNEVGAGSSADVMVEAGTYIVTPESVDATDAVYVASAMEATISDGQVVTVPLSYTPTTGNLELTVSGLPAPTDVASLSITGPSAQNVSVSNGTFTIRRLLPGDYRIPTTTFTKSGINYKATGIPFKIDLAKTTRASLKFIVVEDPADPPEDSQNPVTLKFNASFSDRNITKMTLKNVTTGRVWWLDLQIYGGRSAGSMRVGTAKYSWEALPQKYSAPEIKVPAGRYVITDISTKGNGYIINAVGVMLTSNGGQIRIVNPTQAYEKPFGIHKSIGINSEFDIGPGTYNFVTGVDPQVDLGFATGGQWLEVKCSALETLLVEWGCVDNP